jgi:hypothetical protein
MKALYLFLITNLISGCNHKDDFASIIDKNDYPVPVIIEKALYYVATNGNDKNPGTYDQPWATWQKAFTRALAGDTVYIRGGIYYADNADEYGVYAFRKAGTNSYPICIFNYPGESPVLDCSSITRSADITGIYLYQCNYFHLKGLTVQGVRQPVQNANSNGFSIENSTGDKFEKCISRMNGGSGFSAYKSDSVYYINCDSYDNFDQLTAGYSGGQADGFVVCFASSKAYTYFKGCRSWYNSDDGYDCWHNEGIVVFEKCWSFNNGRGDGDGCGFKLGETESQPLGVPQRILTNCLAFKNRFIAFNQNEGNVKMTLYNNIAYDNDQTGYDLSLYQNVITVKNNISYKNSSKGDFAKSVIHDHNSWDASPSVSVSDADFISIDSSGVSGPRKPDGSLPGISFLKLAAGSDLINAGTDVGLPFLGIAPDLGPFEKE